MITVSGSMTDDERMAAMDERVKRAKEQDKKYDDYFFFLRIDEKAIIHPLLNIPRAVELPYHEKYDAATNKFVVSAVCAAAFGQDCKLCQEAASDKKLTVKPRFFLPVYMHGVWKLDLINPKNWVPVTVKSNGVDVAIKGVRMLEMKHSSDLLDSFRGEYWESESHDIRRADFTIARVSDGEKKSKYTLTRREKVAVLPADLPAFDEEKIRSDVALRRAPQFIETIELDEEVPVSTGSVLTDPFLPEEF